MSKQKLIGKGTYGCVYRPQFPCKGEKVETGKVSKVMEKRYALDEIQEMKKIDKIDSKYEFHLSTPKLCDFDKLTSTQKRNLQECSNLELEWVRQKDIPMVLEDKDIKLLQIDDGGMSLSSIINNLSIDRMPLTKVFIYEMMKSFEPIFKGLVKLNQKKFVHFDIKPDNIVYNTVDEKMKFIDWGLSGSYSKIAKSDFANCRMYWVLPSECLFLCKSEFKLLELASGAYNDETRDFYLKQISKHMEKTYNESYSSVFDKHYAHNSLYKTTIDMKELREYAKMFKSLGKTEFKNQLISSLDTFSVGLILAHMLVYMSNKRFAFNPDSMLVKLQTDRKRASIEGLKTFKEIHRIVSGMLEPRFSRRTKPQELYKQITEFYKRNTSVVNIDVVEKEIKHKKQQEVQKECPDGKILNPSTQRCVSVNGKLGKQIKQERIVEELRKLEQGNCPEHKVKNPRTGRCVSRTGALGRKILETRKIRDQRKSKKECPPNKVMNPRTRRCVNKNGVVAKKLKLV